MMYTLTYTCPRCGIITDLEIEEELGIIENKVDDIWNTVRPTCDYCGREVSKMNLSIIEVDPPEFQPEYTVSPVIVAS